MPQKYKVLPGKKPIAPPQAEAGTGSIPASGSPRYSVEWTIEEMIATYPSLFQSRTQAIHHLFIVLGCGYRWRDGKLVEVMEDRTTDRIPREAARILAQHRPKLERPVYPWTDRCNLATMPAAVDEDWKAAAEEARQILANTDYPERISE